MDGYVSKPVEAEELFAAIEGIGGDRGRTAATNASARPATAVLDRETILRRVGADPELLLETIQTFNDESVELLREIRRGIASSDAGHLERIAHSLKGALRTLAAPAASEAALELERMARGGVISPESGKSGASSRARWSRSDASSRRWSPEPPCRRRRAGHETACSAARGWRAPSAVSGCARTENNVVFLARL